MDFFKIKERSPKRGVIEVYPDFRVCRSNDLMVRAGSFYAIWDQEKGMWSTDEYDVQRLVDQELYAYRDRMPQSDSYISVMAMQDFSSRSWVQFKTYLSHMSDSNHLLDEKLTFSNTVVHKKDYISKRLPYPLEPGPCPAYEEIISTLYDEDERAKLEWAIGSIVAGDSVDIQKFIVLYGEAGAGKSTVLNIIQSLFEGYYTTFDAKALGSANNSFSTEVFKGNPLVGIQHDGDLSRIEDNTKINSIVSHEEMAMNEKFKPTYTSKANCFLFMATNRPVKITDAKSGIIRRLIDVKPSGRKLPVARYHALMSQINFELGAIAAHCRDIYLDMGKNFYSAYRPLDMIFQTDVFFNFVESSFDTFKEEDGVSLSRAYELYKAYCDDSLVDFKLARHKFREELKNYFREFHDVTRINGKQLRSYYEGFLTDKFSISSLQPKKEKPPLPLSLDCEVSIFDEECAGCKAQYADGDKPEKPWSMVKTALADIDTGRVHYLLLPIHHIVIDFDLRDEKGEKNAYLNLEAASKWPPTYAEYSKSGAGIHLHYIYDGDPEKLSRVYSEGIEIKVFSGRSSLRRRLSKCNNLPIAHINSGLPLKGEKMISQTVVKSERGIRDLIARNLAKEIHPGTKPSIDFIAKILEDANASGMIYDVTDLRPRVMAFANNSSNHADYCVRRVAAMPFKSDAVRDISPEDYPDGKIIFFDIEVFPNLLLVNWKFEGEGSSMVRMINPEPKDLEELFRGKLVGYNCRRYDNHILYARYLGYSIPELFKLSQRIVTSKDQNCFFSEAYNLSYTDIYDFAATKQSLKKWEIELGIHHQELGLPWDQPVPEEKWQQVAEYCDNDVIATEAVFNHLHADWTARQILADLAGGMVNDTTNSLTGRFIFGSERKPQSQFNYRFMGDWQKLDDISETIEQMKLDPEYTAFEKGKPVFPGYSFDRGKSIYRGIEVGEGGYVYAEPGMYFNVALLDIASMHPSSVVNEQLFGPIFTARFQEILNARIAIKHKDWESASKMLDGKLAPYLGDKSSAKALSNALKIAINSVYGLTSAKFDNLFRDKRNVDNIVAKRGALFMVNLCAEVQRRGFTVAHIKTDSIKIPDATPEIISFVMDYGKLYGYNFEHEATYDRMCLVNNAVYIAKFLPPEMCDQLYGYIPEKNQDKGGRWEPTGAQFADPYVFKTLFSREPIVFSDYCQTKSVQGGAIYLDFNENLPDVTEAEEELKRRIFNAAHPDHPKRLKPEWKGISDDELKDGIAEGHSYMFVGKVGSFCPILPGHGAGLCMRLNDGKYFSVTGTNGYRWMEAESVKNLGLEDAIDMSYFRALIDDAVENISKYGDMERFIFGKPVIDTDPPPWFPPCGEGIHASCFDCDQCKDGSCTFIFENKEED